MILMFFHAFETRFPSFFLIKNYSLTRRTLNTHNFHFLLQQVSVKLLLALILGSSSKSRVFEKIITLASF